MITKNLIFHLSSYEFEWWVILERCLSELFCGFSKVSKWNELWIKCYTLFPLKLKLKFPSLAIIRKSRTKIENEKINSFAIFIAASHCRPLIHRFPRIWHPNSVSKKCLRSSSHKLHLKHNKFISFRRYI